MSTKEATKVAVSLVGPGPDYYENSPDRDSRSVVVTVEVKVDISREDRFQMESHTNRYNGKWTDPYLMPFRWEVYGRHIDLEEAEHAVKRLTAFRRYVQKLPYPPRTLGDYLSALFAFLKVRTVGQYIHYPDQKARPEEHKEEVGGAYVLYQVEAAYRALQNLNQKEESL